MNLRFATYADAEKMYHITLRVHAISYDDLIPTSHKGRYERAYTFSSDKLQSFVREIMSHIDSDDWLVLVGEYEGRVVAYTQREYAQKENKYYLRGLFVLPLFQRKGIGRELFLYSISRGVKKGSEIELSVVDKNHRAIRIYEKNGFIIKDESVSSFYGAKRIVMSKSIN